METSDLTEKEKLFLSNFKIETERGEKSQVTELFMNCNSPYQFAKTHSTYVKDWEKTKRRLEDNLKREIFPPGVSASLLREIINVSDGIIQKKLELVRLLFESKFHESIYNYLGPDGKTKFLGIF